MSTVYLIHGFLGVGKSTLSLLIAEHTKGVRLSADEWYITLFGDDGQIGIDGEAEDRLRRLLWRLWPAIAAADADVVLDMGFWTRAERDRARQVCMEVGARAVLFEVVAEEAVAFQRCLIRNKAPSNAFFIDRWTYDTLRTGFEPLDADEPHVTVHT